MSDPKKFEKLLNVILIIMLLAVITADRNPELRDFGVVFVVLTAIATSFAAVHFGHFSFMKSEGL